MRRVAIIGVGLMGGSIGLRLRADGFRGTVTGSSRDPARRAEALRRGAVDRAYADPADAAAGADVVIICTPVLRIAELARRIRPRLRAGALVTDVGSTKRHVCAATARALRGSGAVFVGSHPIAGSEKQGIRAARPNLYEGATVVVTPTAQTPPAAARAVARFWARLGGRVVVRSPAEHDRILARTSHGPHLAAAALAAAVGRNADAAALRAFCGPGFRDTTRIAGGSPEVWEDIVRTNRAAVAREVRVLARRLECLLASLRTADYDAVRRFLEAGRAARARVLTGRYEDKERGQP